MFEFAPDINKEFILNRVSQEEIFERHLGEPVVIGDFYRSPLRDDRHPTCSFRYLPSGVLRFRDWKGDFEGDCFNLVQRMFNLNFYDACKHIARDFKLISESGKGFERKLKIYKQVIYSKAKIEVKWKKFNKMDLAYWEKFGITPKILNLFKVAPVQFVWVNGRLVYTSNLDDPGYAYYFGPNDIKVYFPYRKEFRFIGNSSLLQGYEQLPKTGKTLIVTKSMKDVMSLYAYGFPSVAPQTEACILSPDQYQDLSNRFPEIISFYDFDLTGVRSANKMRKIYGIKAKFLTNGRFGTKDYFAKDFSELVSNGSLWSEMGTLHIPGQVWE